jgi:hypothetical protein
VIRFPPGTGNISPPHHVQTCSGAHPAYYQLGNGGGGGALGVKRPGREADHPRTSSAEVKNEWSYTYTP